MPFPRKLLNEGEDVILDLRPHWRVLAKPALSVVLAAALVLVVANRIDHEAPAYAAVVVLLAALAWLLGRYLRWASTDFVVTTDRLVHRAGALRKSGREIPLERLGDITVEQSLFERVLGAGGLVIESGGERGRHHFTDVRRPFVVQHTIYREIERAQARDIRRLQAEREPTIPEQLEKLDELRRRGVITQAEFERKKTQLLDRL